MIMKSIYIKDLKAGREVLLKGWIYEIRNLAKLKFLLIRDSTGIVQCVINDKLLIEKFSELSLESVVEIKGKVKKAKVKAEFVRRDVEIEVSDIRVISKSEKLPIHVNEKTTFTDLSKRLDYRSLDLRKPKNLAIFRIQSALIEGMQNYLNKERFIQVFTPSLMGVASESGSEVFEVKYFNKKAFLRQDPQLHRQLTILGGIEKLYDIGPSWRAEKSHTIKHICEHRTCAVELAFIKDERDTMKIEEEMIVSAIKNVIDKCKDELNLLGIKLKVPKIPFPELKFPEIYDILKKKGKDIYGEDLDAESEKILWEHIKNKYNSDFYFFNGFPHKIKPFYVMEGSLGNEQWAKSVDLNFRGMELSSGGQREHRYDNIIKNIKERGMSLESVEWFTKFFKYGAPPHGGFAIGIERLTQVLLNLQNIREAVLFPRDTERTTP
jgi:nondiscriminating aspartyl-tRNA synthetase